MGEYLRFAAAALIGLILVLVVGRQSRDLGMLLSLAVCVLLALGAMEFLEPVMELLNELKRLGELDSGAVGSSCGARASAWFRNLRDSSAPMRARGPWAGPCRSAPTPPFYG